MMNFKNAFSTDYDSARAKFRELSQQLTDDINAYPVSSAGEDMTIDVSILGKPQSMRMLVVSSGLHGVEGFVGSAVQVALLDGLINQSIKLDDCCLVLIHAINPYGFKHLRRVNEENVDLNRNFLVDFDNKPSSTEYAKFDNLLNPQTDAGGFDLFTLKACLYICRYGIASLRHSISAGQYDFPEGLFFGGESAAKSTRLVEQILKGIANKEKTILHVDIHSGLGRYADYKLLLSSNNQLSNSATYASIFDPEKIERIGERGGITSAISGTISDYFTHLLGDNYHHLGLEFGTYSNLRLLKIMRLENAAHHHFTDNDGRHGIVKAAFLDCFCPPDPRWRATVLEHGMTVLKQVISH